jgi:GNAT superfamily N-acetyltransferase
MTEIRRYVPTDWPRLEEIITKIWSIGLDHLRESRYGHLIGGKPWHQWKCEAIRSHTVKNPNYFVTEVDGRVIGFCSYVIDSSTNIGEVTANGVDPDFVGKGHGERQLAYVLDQLKASGVEIVEVTTALNDGHSPARRMYERAGFEPLLDSRRYTMKLR